PFARAFLHSFPTRRSSDLAHVDAMTRAIGRSVNVTHHFLVTHSGIATRLTPEEARKVRTLPGIASMERERVYHVDTYRGPAFIGDRKSTRLNSSHEWISYA